MKQLSPAEQRQQLENALSHNRQTMGFTGILTYLEDRTASVAGINKLLSETITILNALGFELVQRE